MKKEKRNETKEVAVATPAVSTSAVPTTAISQFGLQNPQSIVENATKIAEVLADIIAKKELFTIIRGKKYVWVEGWTTLGALLGVFPQVEWSRERVPGVWEARVSVRTLAGDTVSSAESECSSKEIKKTNFDSFAIRSMAETRATSKAFRLAFSWIMVLGGYQPTPAEEMEDSEKYQSQPIQELPPQYLPKAQFPSPSPLPSVQEPQPQPELISKAQLISLENLRKSKSISEEEFKSWLKNTYQIDHRTQIPKPQYLEIVKKLQQNLPKTSQIPNSNNPPSNIEGQKPTSNTLTHTPQQKAEKEGEKEKKTTFSCPKCKEGELEFWGGEVWICDTCGYEGTKE